MNSIAWAIFCAALIIMPFRDKTDINYEINNKIDVLLFIVGFVMLVYWSFKS